MSFTESEDDSDAKRRRYLTACFGKHPFATRAMASEVARRRSKKGRGGTVYKCKGCGKFHIGDPAWSQGRKT